MNNLDLHEEKLIDGPELDDEDYEDLLSNCYGILQELQGRRLPKRLMKDVYLTLERLEDALSFHRIH